MQKHSRIDTLFVLIILCVFAVSALASLAFGGSVYKNAIEQSHERYDERTSFFYIWTKVKNADEYGRVYVDQLDGVDTLILEEELFGGVYLTYIYHHDGWLKEIFGDAEYEYNLADGQSILNLKDTTLRFEQLAGSVIRVSDSKQSLIVTPRTGKAAS